MYRRHLPPRDPFAEARRAVDRALALAAELDDLDAMAVPTTATTARPVTDLARAILDGATFRS